MKRKLALIMATAVVAGTVPAIPAHAASSNKTDISPVTIGEDDTLASGRINLLVKEDGTQFKTGKPFYVQLGADAEWNVTTGTGITVGGFNVDLDKVTDTRLKITFNNNPTTAEDTFTLPLTVTHDNAKGEQKVKLEGEESGVTSGEVTYAIVSGDDTTTVVLDSKETVTRGSARDAATFEVREVTTGAFKNAGVFKMKLPADFEWNAGTTVKMNGTALATTIVSGDERTMEVTIAGATAGKDIITIVPKINVTKDAKYGDVDVAISDKNASGISSESGKVIAEYKAYGVDVKVDKVKDMLGGKVEDTSKDYEVEVTLKGTDKDSFLSGRDIDFTVNDGKVRPKDIATLTGGTGITTNYDDEFSLTVPTGNTKDEFKLKFQVKADNDQVGDMKLTVQGAGIDKQEVVIAKILAPATVEAKKGEGKLADVRIGVQNQEAPELVIGESQGGALEKGIYVIDFDKDYYGVSFIDDDAKFEVVEGDIQMEDPDTYDNGRKLVFEVKSESRKPAKIKITGLKLSLDRIAPEGILQARLAKAVNAAGDICPNLNTAPADYKKITKFDFINIVTAAPGASKVKTVFTLENSKFTVIENGVAMEKTMDAAPAVVDGRALLPIRYVANALGVKDDAILWDNATRTATFFKGDRVVKMTLGSKTLIVNGTPVEMEVAPVVKNGRAMVPVRALANAFGVNLNWDDAAKTITVEY